MTTREKVLFGRIQELRKICMDAILSQKKRIENGTSDKNASNTLTDL